MTRKSGSSGVVRALAVTQECEADPPGTRSPPKTEGLLLPGFEGNAETDACRVVFEGEIGREFGAFPEHVFEDDFSASWGSVSLPNGRPGRLCGGGAGDFDLDLGADGPEADLAALRGTDKAGLYGDLERA